MERKIDSIIILLLFLLSCASQQSVVEHQEVKIIEEIEPGDALELFINLSHRAKFKNFEFTEQEISNLTATFDSLCEHQIIVSKSNDLEKLQQKIDQTFLIDTLLSRYTIEKPTNRFVIAFKELKFRTLVECQKRLEEIFENEEAFQQVEDQRKKGEDVDYRGLETHKGWVFKEKVSFMLPYIQANQRYSLVKTNYLSELIQSLSWLKEKSERKRSWLAIDRMLAEIDLKKSESGYTPFQRSAHGIFVSPGKILSQLIAQQEKESDEEIRQLATDVIQKVEQNLIEKIYENFRDQVEASKELNRKFERELASSKSSEIESTIDGLIAAEWFDMGLKIDDEQLKIEYYSKAIALDTQYTAAYANRGTAYKNLGRNNEALGDFDRAIALDSLFAPGFLNRGNIYQDLVRYNEAIRDYDRAIVLEPGYTLAYDYRGMCHKNLSNYDEAIRDFGRAIELEPNYASAFNNRGDVQRYRGKNLEAIQDYTQAIELDPNYALAYNNRGICYRNLKKYDRAILDHRKAIDIMPDFAAAYYNLGCVYWEVKDWNKVIQYWEKCLEINPHHQQALEWLPKAKNEVRVMR